MAVDILQVISAFSSSSCYALGASCHTGKERLAVRASVTLQRHGLLSAAQVCRAGETPAAPCALGLNVTGVLRRGQCVRERKREKTETETTKAKSVT